MLVADDSRAQRRILAASLRSWGYTVNEAGTGDAALAQCMTDPPDIVICDWIMPGLHGPDLCRAVRRFRKDRYVYVILLTSKSGSERIAEGLESGADDYLSKPLNPVELRARLTAGHRILRMERDLHAQNRLVTDTLERITQVYKTLDRDLCEARKLQRSLVPAHGGCFMTGQVTYLFQPSGPIGGDLVGQFRLSEDRVGVFAIDVSGHGIASALITARVAGWLSGAQPEQNLALQWQGSKVVARPPHEVCRKLNEIFNSEIDTEHYFTMALAIVDFSTGLATVVQAGHPPPLVQRATGEVEFIGEGGLPIGLIDDATYDSFEVQLNEGDRMFLYSDGLTECESKSGIALAEQGLAAIFRRHPATSGHAFIDELSADLMAWRQVSAFDDDLSGVLIHRTTG